MDVMKRRGGAAHAATQGPLTSPSRFQLSFKGTAIGGLRYKKAARIVSGFLEKYE